MRGGDVATLLAGARAGSARDLGRLLTVLEDGAGPAREVMRLLAGIPGRAVVVGITGPPGVGKSTTTSALVAALRSRGQRVGVLAVDPSSPFSGGALLGDRVRMTQHATDAGVFVRSMAARGHLGGLAVAVPQAIDLLAVVGFDVVVVETVGVGQSEIEIAAAADTTLVLLAPGAGDGVQAAKAGVLEVADVFVVNKADQPGADATVRDLRAAVRLREGGGWAPPVVRLVATTGSGVTDVLDAIDAHQELLGRSGDGDARRRRRSIAQVRALAVAELERRLAEHAVAAAADRVDADTAAEHLVADLIDPGRSAPMPGIGIGQEVGDVGR